MKEPLKNSHSARCLQHFYAGTAILGACPSFSLPTTHKHIAWHPACPRKYGRLALSSQRGISPIASPKPFRAYLRRTAIPVGATHYGSSRWLMRVRTPPPRWLETPLAHLVRGWKSLRGPCKRPIGSVQA